MDKRIPPTALLDALSKKWAPGAGDDEVPKSAVQLTRANVNLIAGYQTKTRRVPHNILCTLAGRYTKGVDQLTFLAVDRYELV